MPLIGLDLEPESVNQTSDKKKKPNFSEKTTNFKF